MTPRIRITRKFWTRVTGVKLLKDVFVTVVLVAIFICLVEIAMRLAGVNYDASFYHLEREFGYALRPGAEGWNVKEHENYVRISSQGLRDREHTLQRPANVIRIAVVGDSFAEAREVDQGATYWSVMEQELNRILPAGSPRIEVINFGVDGYGLAQEYMVIKRRIWQYDPQIIILSGTLHSFILRSSRKFGTKSSEGSVPYYMRRNGGLVLDSISVNQQAAFVSPSHWSEAIADLSNESRVLSLFNAARRKLSTEAGDFERRIGSPPSAATEVSRSDENAVLRGPVDPDYSEAWAIGEELIRYCHAEAVRHHAEFWLFLLDMAPQVDPDAGRRTAMMRDLGIDDLFIADKSLADFATQEEIMHATLAQSMFEFVEENHVVLHGFKNLLKNKGHWNEMGHRVAGRLIAQKLFDCSAVIRGNQAPSAVAQQQACNAGARQ
jgi:hypothetical protein